jgi:1,4-dihydroxy-2-naphthoyl-CoA hydrolase
LPILSEGEIAQEPPDRRGVLRAAETPGPLEGGPRTFGCGALPHSWTNLPTCRKITVTSSVPPGLGGGFDSELGLTLLEVTADGGRAQVTITDKLLQPWGIVHGGVYCSIIESLASVSAHVWLTADGGGGTVVGVNNNTDFLRAISSGTVTAVSTPIHRGRRQQLWLITITDDRDRLVARGQVRLQNLPDAEPVSAPPS